MSIQNSSYWATENPEAQKYVDKYFYRHPYHNRFSFAVLLADLVPGGKLVGVFGPASKKPKHAAVKINNLYLDARGELTEEDFKKDFPASFTIKPISQEEAFSSAGYEDELPQAADAVDSFLAWLDTDTVESIQQTIEDSKKRLSLGIVKYRGATYLEDREVSVSKRPKTKAYYWPEN